MHAHTKTNSLVLALSQDTREGESIIFIVILRTTKKVPEDVTDSDVLREKYSVARFLLRNRLLFSIFFGRMRLKMNSEKTKTAWPKSKQTKTRFLME
jgi:hypothetical protein